MAIQTVQLIQVAMKCFLSSVATPLATTDLCFRGLCLPVCYWSTMNSWLRLNSPPLVPVTQRMFTNQSYGDDPLQ